MSTMQTACFAIGRASRRHVPASDRLYKRNIQNCRTQRPSMHIATAPELWFERLGKSPPAAPPADERGPAWGVFLAAGLDLQRRSPMRQGRATTISLKGAMTR